MVLVQYTIGAIGAMCNCNWAFAFDDDKDDKNNDDYDDQLIIFTFQCLKPTVQGIFTRLVSWRWKHLILLITIPILNIIEIVTIIIMATFKIWLLNFQTWTGSPQPPPCQSPPPHTGRNYSQIFWRSEYLDIFFISHRWNNLKYFKHSYFWKLDIFTLPLPTRFEYFGLLDILLFYCVSPNLAFLRNLRCWNSFLGPKSKVHNIWRENIVKQRKPKLSFCQVERCPGCARPCQAPGRKWGKLSLNILIGISRPVSCFMSSWPVFIFPSSYSESSSSYPSNLCILPLQTFYLNLSCSTADLKRFSPVQLEYLSPVLKPSLILPELNTALARVLVPICIWTPYSGGATICIWSANKCR